MVHAESTTIDYLPNGKLDNVRDHRARTMIVAPKYARKPGFACITLILIMASLGELVFPLPSSGKIRHPLFDQRRERRHPKMRHLIG